MYNNKLSNQMKSLVFVGSLMLALLVLTRLVQSAPTTSSSNNPNQATNTASPISANGSSTRRPNIFLSLFRRQVNNSNAQTDESETTEPSEESSETEMLPIEVEAQKFLETIPGYSNNNNNKETREPSTFRERMSDTFGLLREGWSNQFKALRDNFSDTVEDIRETWSGSQQD